MSVERVKEYLKKFNADERVLEFNKSSATVELAAKAVGVDAARIAKTLAFEDGDSCLLIVAAGDARIDNTMFKARFGHKARMLTPEKALELTGYAVGGVSPFDLNESISVWLDESLKRFGTIFPACGSPNSAIEVSCDELNKFSKAQGWVDVCKSWRGTYPRIIDMHTHIFPDALAARTMEKLMPIADGAKPVVMPTYDNTMRYMKNHAISAFAALSIATKPTQCTTINNYAANIKSGYVLSFGTIHPDFPEPIKEIERVKQLGLHGIKLHPDYQNIIPDDECMFPLYEKMRELNLPVVFHAGWDPVSPDLTRCTPKRLRNVLDRVPGLKVIGAHMGGMKMSNDVMKYLVGQNIYFDTSMSFKYLTPERLLELIQKHGTDKILFGSDCPWGALDKQIELLKSIGLSVDELDMIFHKNAEKLLGLIVDE